MRVLEDNLDPTPPGDLQSAAQFSAHEFFVEAFSGQSRGIGLPREDIAVLQCGGSNL
jgi:hypothetical protein